MKRLLLAATVLAAPLLAPAAAMAADTPQMLVDNSTLAIESIMQTPEHSQISQLLGKARAVVVCPSIFRAGFLLGGEGGSCIMAARASGGAWSDPAFYTLGSASFGFQVGVQTAKVMMLIMTNGGLNAILNSQFKFGADAGLTVATFGAGVNGSMSTALNADIVTISETQGMYGGISLAGSVLANDSGFEQKYYGVASNARAIVVDMHGHNAGGAPLRATLSKFGG